MSSNWVYFSVLRSEIVCCSRRWQDCILGKKGDLHILLHGESLSLIIFGNWYATSSSALSTLMMWSYWQMRIYSWWVFFVCLYRDSLRYDALLIIRQRSIAAHCLFRFLLSSTAQCHKLLQHHHSTNWYIELWTEHCKKSSCPRLASLSWKCWSSPRGCG